MTLTREEVEAHRDLSDGEVASVINKTRGHVRDITSAQLYALLVNELSLLRNTGSGWTGKLVDAVDALPPSPQSAAIKDGLSQLLSNPWSSEIIIRTTDPRIGGLADALDSIAVAITDDSSTVGLHGLTGGPVKYNAGDVKQVRDDIIAEKIESRIINAQALAIERIKPEHTEEQQAIAWANAWVDAEK